MFKDNLKIKGKVEIFLNDKKIAQDNLFTIGGRETVAKWLTGDFTIPHITHIALGTDTTPHTENDVSLNSEFRRDAIDTTTLTSNVIKYTKQYPTGLGTGFSFTELGLFNDATAGVMFARTVFTTIVKGENDRMKIDWTLTVLGS